MIELLGNRTLMRYYHSALVASLCALLLFGCSSTPSPEALQASIGGSTAKVGTQSAPPVATAASEPQGFGTGAPDDELPQIAAPAGRYIIGSGDVVTVTVWGHPELSGKRVIGPDGQIQLPFVGSFKVAGLNADDASRKLTSALREDYLNTAASVIVDSYNSNQIIVLGHVAHQGVQIFSGNPTLLEALATAGTAPSKDDQGAMPVRC